MISAAVPVTSAPEPMSEPAAPCGSELLGQVVDGQGRVRGSVHDLGCGSALHPDHAAARPRGSVAGGSPAVGSLRTGLRVLDGLFPCALGGSCVLPTTTGKHALLQLLLMHSNPDAFVYAALGSALAS